MDISFLQILSYVLGAVLLVCLIVLIIKVIYTVNRVNFLLDNIERKMKTIDQVFGVVNRFVDSFSLFTDKLTNKIVNATSRLFKKEAKEKKEKKEREEK